MALDLSSLLKAFAPAATSAAVTATGVNQTVSSVNQAVTDVNKVLPEIQQDINVAKDVAIGYASTQIVLQMISTGAMCLMAYIAWQEYKKKRSA